MGAICFAVSLRTLAGSSSGPVALVWFRFSNCIYVNFEKGDVGINRGGCLGNGVLFLGKSELNWLLRAFALSRSFIIGWLFTRSVGMPMFSCLFALINDQNSLGLVSWLSAR